VNGGNPTDRDAAAAGAAAPGTARAETDTVHLAVVQMAPALRDTGANAARIAAAASASQYDILLTPELALTGYDVGSAVHRLGVPVRPGEALDVPALAGLPGDVVAGVIEAAPAGPYNCAVAVREGLIVFRQRKLYLPTYGMFDEGRWFGRGRTLDTWTPAPGWRAGVLICEDFWHPGLAYVLASRGIDLLLVQAAAPGRGAWEGGESGDFASADVWERIARTTAQLYGIYVALANRVGVEGGVTFAGGSLIAGPDGRVLARADDASEMTITATLTRWERERARRPYAHARDDDPGIVLRELARTVRS
jgi:predicted amidohydrolase